MSLVLAQDLFLQLGSKTLFDGDAVAIERNDRVGIVGPNGSGKSTLLKILTGQIEPENGKVVRARGLRIGYLAQELPREGAAALLDSVLAAAPRKGEIEQRIAALEAELDADGGDVERATEISVRLADLHAELADVERQFAPHRAQQILFGLGFGPAEFARPVGEFSGGWRMRAELAKLLFQQPELLFLDEPTNHLDLPSVHWLNRFLDSFPHALALICHDKEFLNRHIERVISFEPEGLRAYKGDYDEYQRLRALELEVIGNKAKKDEQKRKDLEAFITRFKAKASKARQAQSKQRLIEKMQEDAVELPPPRRSIAIKFKPVAPGSDPVLELEGVGFAYGTKTVFSGVDATVRRGDRVAIVGLNGAGKTTLLKLIGGELAPQEGAIRFGARATISYFAQHHTEVLDPSRTVLEEVWRVVPQRGQSEVRGICGSFLFSDDEVDKKIGVLSGGEKARVALARLLVEPGNLLLLDEPTNHLDTESASQLTRSLASYDGTMLFVSHDLEFARGLATKVLDVRDGMVRAYPGSLEDYLDKLARDQDALFDPEAALVRGHATAPDKPVRPANDAKAERIAAREDEKEKKKERARLEKKLAAAEARIAGLEAKKAELEARLADASLWDDASVADAVTREHAETAAALDATLAEWERISAAL